MVRRLRFHLPFILAIALSVLGCDSKNSTQPTNHPPIILDLTAFPARLGSGDSTVVICSATDVDNGPLVYDWTTDGRLLIKGANPGQLTLYNSPSPFHVFYHGPTTPFDTAFVQCIVRDTKGGAVSSIVHILVNQ